MNSEYEISLKLAEKIADDRERLLEDISSCKDKLKLLETELLANTDESKLIGASLKRLSITLGLFKEKEIENLTEFQDIIESLKEKDPNMSSIELPPNVIALPRRDGPKDLNDDKYLVTVNDKSDLKAAFLDFFETSQGAESEDISLQEAVNDALQSITSYERLLLSLRFGIGDVGSEMPGLFLPDGETSSKDTLDAHQGGDWVMTYEWVGKQIKGEYINGKWWPVSRQTVSRWVRKALRKLRHPTRRAPLERYSSGKLTCGEERLLHKLGL